MQDLAAPKKTPKKAAAAAAIGSALEYYDFFIYGFASALVFNKVFFPEATAATGTLLALATFGVAYIARPIGAFVLGHIGDKYGRKRILIFTVLLMGASTFLIGCLPSYDTIGPWAPILLVILRLMQGFAASGEQAGANSMTLEHSPEHRRGFYTSFTLTGTQFGLILATASFLPISALPNDQLLSWGWRVPFLLSAVVVIVGLILRRTLAETPTFVQEAEAGATPQWPLKILLRYHWRSVLRIVMTALVSTVSTIFSVFALSFAVNTVGLERTPMLWVGIVTQVVAVASIPLWAMLSDRVGRKPIFIIGTIGPGVMMFAYLGAVASGNLPLIFAAAVLMSGVLYSASTGVFPAFYGEMFPASVRLSGMAIGTQIGFAIAGFGPSIAAAIAGPGTSGWVPVAVMVLVGCVIASIAAATAKETYKIPLAELDQIHTPETVSR
ncbi:MFS transporter [Pseudarthrobacter sp. NIBRBAC000502772]|uniref:MFS transporter n=1 Tax=Pseudarthrobacter sp. NIBRBAC000502772 TaxID=2590775 RepID=UPI001FEF11AB|nr:MFS transporter [Pseudarthrobacter sp. NIBRBAC000502772]